MRHVIGGMCVGHRSVLLLRYLMVLIWVLALVLVVVWRWSRYWVGVGYGFGVGSQFTRLAAACHPE